METTTAPEAPARRPQKRQQAVLEVRSKTRLSPRLLRITLGGELFSALNRNEQADAYVKLLLPDPSTGLQPPFDLERLREESPELLPSRRTYTVRRWFDDEQAIQLDVVLHSAADGQAEGVASRWADAAQPGDRVALMGAGGGYTPEQSTARHLLIGDHSALPAIAASLEAMDPAAVGFALIHLDHEEDRLRLEAPAGVEVRWVIGDRERLLEAVTALDLAETAGLQVFCHAERGLTKRLRRVLVAERGVPREQISISAYWALGRVEDQFQAEKREPIGAIDD
ncbi:siderophore-interacting protein [Brachybacterium sp. J144]|uniref:siderophore-interacting protein n=1 Tax=Brachybacterium sp. J144 TaxID=3116487 RepID=UPI002E75A23E|nr:siderophore-interacting protein [Brachybacterium sp. J144]MEE1649916.1 siderophore-interacting protein [Brachybacterium sp. J144]